MDEAIIYDEIQALKQGQMKIDKTVNSIYGSIGSNILPGKLYLASQQLNPDSINVTIVDVTGGGIMFCACANPGTINLSIEIDDIVYTFTSKDSSKGFIARNIVKEIEGQNIYLLSPIGQSTPSVTHLGKSLALDTFKENRTFETGMFFTNYGIPFKENLKMTVESVVQYVNPYVFALYTLDD